MYVPRAKDTRKEMIRELIGSYLNLNERGEPSQNDPRNGAATAVTGKCPNAKIVLSNGGCLIQ